MKDWPLGVSFVLVLAGFPLLSWGNWGGIPAMWITGVVLLAIAALILPVGYRWMRGAGRAKRGRGATR